MSVTLFNYCTILNESVLGGLTAFFGLGWIGVATGIVQTVGRTSTPLGLLYLDLVASVTLAVTTAYTISRLSSIE